VKTVDKSFKELLITVGNQIDHAELNAAIKNDNFEGEFALSDDGLTSAKEQVGKLLTLESAINNPSVIERINKESYPKHMKTALSKYEDQLRPLFQKIGVEFSDSEFISDKIGEIEEKLSTALATGDKREVIEKLNEELRLAREVPTKLEEDFNNKIKERDESYRLEKLRDKFVLKANEFTWADAYSDKDLKRALLRDKWDAINAKAHLTLSEDGDIRLMQKDMPDKELYDGNNKLMTFQSMLEPELEPYLKKSSPEKVRTETTVEKPVKAVTAQEARNMKEYEAQKRMHAQ
jgi:hypothetical protein